MAQRPMEGGLTAARKPRLTEAESSVSDAGEWLRKTALLFEEFPICDIMSKYWVTIIRSSTCLEWMPSTSLPKAFTESRRPDMMA